MLGRLSVLFLSLAWPTFAIAQDVRPAERLPLERSQQCEGGYCVELLDMTPRFLAFYEAAAALPKDDINERHALWTRHYGFAAVPPGPRGEAMARSLLDQGWPLYSEAIGKIRQAVEPLRTQPAPVVASIARLLRLDAPYKVQLIAFVGAFEENAFTAGQAGAPVVAVPLEIPAERRDILLAHEMTHALHMGIGNSDGGWERPIATTILQEGLAMHVARAVVPGKDVTAYVEHVPGWWDKARAGKREILRNLLPVLARSDGETVFRFTMGQGSTGLEREAYVAGWLVVERLLAEGMDLAAIARISGDDQVKSVGDAIERILQSEK